MHNYEKLLKRLLDNGVEFVLIGGFAAVVHGCTTLTRDVDACILFTTTNMAKLLKALDDVNPRFQQNKRTVDRTAEELARLNNLYLLTDLGSIDLLGEVAEIGNYKEVFDHSLEMELFGTSCRVLDIDALIRSKEKMGRPKDKEAIVQLRAIKDSAK